MSRAYLTRKERLYKTAEVARTQGRAVGRDGFVTMRIVAHAMNLAPSGYVMALLDELFHAGRLHKRIEFTVSGRQRNLYMHSDNKHLSKQLPF